MNIVGSSGVIGEQSMPWIRNSSNNSSQGTRKKRQAVKNGHEIFAKYAQMTNDPYWKNVFETASRRNIKGVRIRNGYMTHGAGKKAASIHLESGPGEIIKFMSKYLSMRSSDEMSEDNICLKETRQYLDSRTYKTWSDIKSSSVINQLVIEYCNKITEKYSLNNLEINSLRTIIHVNLNLCNINQDNIILVNKTIDHINNLIWNPKSRKFYVISNNINNDIDNSLNIDNINKNTKNKKSAIEISWSKYLDDVKKNYKPDIQKSTVNTVSMYFTNGSTGSTVNTGYNYNNVNFAISSPLIVSLP